MKLSDCDKFSWEASVLRPSLMVLLDFSPGNDVEDGTRKLIIVQVWSWPAGRVWSDKQIQSVIQLHYHFHSELSGLSNYCKLSNEILFSSDSLSNCAPTDIWKNVLCRKIPWTRFLSLRIDNPFTGIMLMNVWGTAYWWWWLKQWRWQWLSDDDDDDNYLHVPKV